MGASVLCRTRLLSTCLNRHNKYGVLRGQLSPSARLTQFPGVRLIATRLRCRFAGFAAVLVGLLTALPVQACPFCTMSGQTLTDDVNQASMVLYGKLTNAKPGNGDFGGTTDLVIEAIVKKHEILGDKPTIVTLPRYVP